MYRVSRLTQIYCINKRCKHHKHISMKHTVSVSSFTTIAFSSKMLFLLTRLYFLLLPIWFSLAYIPPRSTSKPWLFGWTINFWCQTFRGLTWLTSLLLQLFEVFFERNAFKSASLELQIYCHMAQWAIEMLERKCLVLYLKFSRTDSFRQISRQISRKHAYIFIKINKISLYWAQKCYMYDFFSFSFNGTYRK